MIIYGDLTLYTSYFVWLQTTESQELVPDLPVIEELLRDVNDGCCLATVVSFYCPQVLELKSMYSILCLFQNKCTIL